MTQTETFCLILFAFFCIVGAILIFIKSPNESGFDFYQKMTGTIFLSLFAGFAFGVTIHANSDKKLWIKNWETGYNPYTRIINKQKSSASDTCIRDTTYWWNHDKKPK